MSLATYRATRWTGKLDQPEAFSWASNISAQPSRAHRLHLSDPMDFRDGLKHQRDDDLDPQVDEDESQLPPSSSKALL